MAELPVAPQAQPLWRLIGSPELAMAVAGMDGRALAASIRHVGLEDAGALLSLATAEQLSQALDEDLWRLDKPGQAERFDAERFGLFLEVLLDQGEATAVEKLLALDRDLLAAGFSQLLYVVSRERLQFLAADEEAGSLFEKALEARPNMDLDFFHVAIARGEQAWDAAIRTLVAIGEQDGELQEWVLERCAEATASLEDEHGNLYEVFTHDQAMLGDLADARERRRSALGFVPSQDAAAFLKLAASLSPADALAAPADDAITRAYFKGLDQARAAAAKALPPPAANAAARALSAASDDDAAPEIVDAAALVPGSLAAHMDALPPEQSLALQPQLAFLVNAFLAVQRPDSRERSARAAAAAVLAACERGWQSAKAVQRVPEPLDLIQLFKAGWPPGKA